jgi:hypothetical protein
MIQLLRILTDNRIKEDKGGGDERLHEIPFSTVRRKRLGTERQRAGARYADKRLYMRISRGMQQGVVDTQ